MTSTKGTETLAQNILGVFLNSDNNEHKFIDAAVELINPSKIIKVSDLFPLRFMEARELIVKKNDSLSDDEIIASYKQYASFVEELLNIADVKSKINNKAGIFQQEISPSLQAYKYAGHNKLDIKQSDDSHAVLHLVD